MYTLYRFLLKLLTDSSGMWIVARHVDWTDSGPTVKAAWMTHYRTVVSMAYSIYDVS